MAKKGKGTTSEGNFIFTPASSTTSFLRYLTKQKILIVGFRTGKLYHYNNVPVEVWQEYKAIIATGASSGSFFNSHIRDQYTFVEMSQ